MPESGAHGKASMHKVETRTSRASSFTNSLVELKRRVYMALFVLIFVATSLGSVLSKSLDELAWAEILFGPGLGVCALVLLLVTAFTSVRTRTIDLIALGMALSMVPLRAAALLLGPTGVGIQQYVAESAPWSAAVFILIFVMLKTRQALFWSLMMYAVLIAIAAIHCFDNAATLTRESINLLIQYLVVASAAQIALLLMLIKTKQEFEKADASRRRLASLASTDVLTGIPNRRRFMVSCDLAINDAESAELPTAVSLILMDVDHFKEVNDSYGHAIGDEVLKRVASTIAENARDSDAYGRIGGEEFAVLLPGVEIEMATAIAQRLRAAIEDMDCPKCPPITASLGVAAWQNGEKTAALLRRADKALYHAKSLGRNQVSTMYEYELPGKKGTRRDA